MSPDQAQQRAERLVDAWSNQTYPGLRSLCHLIAAELLAVQRECAERVAELESALRLHLAIGPEDPLLLTPIEHQLADAQARVKDLEQEQAAIKQAVSREFAKKSYTDEDRKHEDLLENIGVFLNHHQELEQQRATLRERCEALETAVKAAMQSLKGHDGYSIKKRSSDGIETCGSDESIGGGYCQREANCAHCIGRKALATGAEGGEHAKS